MEGVVQAGPRGRTVDTPGWREPIDRGLYAGTSGAGLGREAGFCGLIGGSAIDLWPGHGAGALSSGETTEMRSRRPVGDTPGCSPVLLIVPVKV